MRSFYHGFLVGLKLSLQVYGWDIIIELAMLRLVELAQNSVTSVYNYNYPSLCEHTQKPHTTFMSTNNFTTPTLIHAFVFCLPICQLTFLRAIVGHLASFLAKNQKTRFY